MKPAVIEAIEVWEQSWKDTADAAANALKTAFPPLGNNPTPAYCCDVMLAYTHEGLGSGRVCIDSEGRGTIEFDDVPNDVIAEAIDEVFGIGWFHNADDALEDCEPGTYFYDDETTGAEYEVKLGESGEGKVHLSYVQIPDAATILDALTRAAEDDQDQEEDVEALAAAT